MEEKTLIKAIENLLKQDIDNVFKLIEKGYTIQWFVDNKNKFESKLLSIVFDKVLRSDMNITDKEFKGMLSSDSFAITYLRINILQFTNYRIDMLKDSVKYYGSLIIMWHDVEGLDKNIIDNLLSNSSRLKIIVDFNSLYILERNIQFDSLSGGACEVVLHAMFEKEYTVDIKCIRSALCNIDHLDIELEKLMLPIFYSEYMTFSLSEEQKINLIKILTEEDDIKLATLACAVYELDISIFENKFSDEAVMKALEFMNDNKVGFEIMSELDKNKQRPKPTKDEDIAEHIGASLVFVIKFSQFKILLSSCKSDYLIILGDRYSGISDKRAEEMFNVNIILYRNNCPITFLEKIYELDKRLYYDIALDYISVEDFDNKILNQRDKDFVKDLIKFRARASYRIDRDDKDTGAKICKCFNKFSSQEKIDILNDFYNMSSNRCVIVELFHLVRYSDVCEELINLPWYKKALKESNSILLELKDSNEELYNFILEYYNLNNVPSIDDIPDLELF